MRFTLFLAVVISVLGGLAGGAGATRYRGAAVQAESGTAGYIVVFNRGVDANGETTGLERELGFRSRLRYGHALQGFAAQLSAEQVDRLRARPLVDFVSPDRVVEISGMVPVAQGEFVPTGVRRMNAATQATVHTTSRARVAIIDTGISLSHPDLNARNGTNCLQPGTPARDDNGHGTHVAGIIGAKNNGSGIVGVAPNTRLFAVKTLDSTGHGTESQVICGIDWVTAHGPGTRKNIRVANMSLGFFGSNDNNCGNTNNDPLHKAICGSVAKGITYAVAAMNNTLNFAQMVPAAYPEVLTVTAMSDSDGAPGGRGPAPCGQPDDVVASWSDWAVASTEINHTVAGPGVCIRSDWLNNGFNTISGTSMATPHVAGSIALCINDNGVSGPCANKTPAQIIQQIRSDAAAHATLANGFSGDPNRPIAGKYFGYLVDASSY
jgi:subtilisin